MVHGRLAVDKFSRSTDVFDLVQRDVSSKDAERAMSKSSMTRGVPNWFTEVRLIGHISTCDLHYVAT